MGRRVTNNRYISVDDIFDWFERIWPILLVPVGWLGHKFREIQVKIEKIENNFFETSRHAKTTYVSKEVYAADQRANAIEQKAARDDMRHLHESMAQFRVEMSEGFNRIYDKIESKADK